MNNFRRRISNNEKPIIVEIGGYKAVDLGLPSGLLWATCNVGAATETDVGNYYQWGAGSTVFLANTNQYSGGSASLQSNYDTATQVMGNGWRMPSLVEIIELSQNLTYVETVLFYRNPLDPYDYTKNEFYSTYASKNRPDAYITFPHGGGYLPDGALYARHERDYYHTAFALWTRQQLWDTHAIYMTGVMAIDTTLHIERNYGFNVRGVHAPI